MPGQTVPVADTGSDALGRWPGPTEQALADVLRTRYGLAVASVEPVAGGQDDAARAFRVATKHSGARYLVKARAASAADVAAAVLRHLAMSGAPHVVAPIVARTGSLSARGDGFAVTVYPFIEGRTGREAGLSEAHWRALGALARRLHATSVPPDLARLLGSETYRPVEVDLVRQVDAAVRSGAVPDDAPPEVVVLWNARRDDILATVERTETFGAELRRRGLPLVLCHADLHTWNVIIDTAGALWLIDWDGAVLAHKERDLMFVVGGIGPGMVEPRETACFFEGYGEETVDPLALAYYRHAWATGCGQLRGADPARRFAGAGRPP